MHRGVIKYESSLLDSFNGAGASASAALDALISVDNILAVAFSNDAEGAGVCTGTAAQTSVSDEICHCEYLHIVFAYRFFIVACFYKKANKKTGKNEKIFCQIIWGRKV